MPRLIWSPTAQRDLQESVEFIRENSPAATASLAKKVMEAVDLLEVMPEIGPVIERLADMGPYRQLLVARYLIIYRLDGDDIVIARSWDARRSPDSLVVK